jgi:hypothetical protein
MNNLKKILDDKYKNNDKSVLILFNNDFDIDLKKSTEIKFKDTIEKQKYKSTEFLVDILSNTYELINLSNIVEYMSYIKYNGWRKMIETEMSKLDKLINIDNQGSIKLKNINYVPVIKDYNISYDKKYKYYELYNNISKNIIPNNIDNFNYAQIILYGPAEIKKYNGKNTLNIHSDFIEINEIFRKNLTSYDIKNNYYVIAKSIPWDEDIKYDNYIISNSINNVNNFPVKISLLPEQLYSYNSVNNIIDKLDSKLYIININSLSQYPKINNLSDEENKYHYLLLLLLIINKLKKCGNVIIPLNKFYISDGMKDILTLYSLCFKRVHYFNSELSDGYMIFECYKKITEEFKNYIDNLIIKIMKTKDTTINQLLSENIYIDRILNTNTKFHSFIAEIYLDIKKRNEYKQHVKDTITDFLSKSKSDEFTNRIIKTCLDMNVKRCLKWCFDNNIQINNYYTDPNVIIDENIIKRMFPIEKGVDMSKIKLSIESTYSVTPPKEAALVNSIILKYLNIIDKNIDASKLSIIDGTANAGGNTIAFSKIFKNVISVELDYETYLMLKNNIDVYGITNVKIVNGDITKVNETADLLFVDPPWGGISYKYYDKVNLYLSEYTMAQFINNTINNFKLICTKVPYNYDIHDLFIQPNIGEIHIHSVGNYKIIAIFSKKLIR